MMRIKEIEDAREEVLRLSKGLKYFNEERKSKQIAMINVFIRLINVAEKLLAGSVDKDIVDTMLLRMFEKEYERCNEVDPVGFISKVQTQMLRDVIAMDVEIGKPGKQEMLAMKLAGDMLANADFLTQAEKDAAIPGNDKLSVLFMDAKDFWMVQLDKILEYCYYKKGVWKR